MSWIVPAVKPKIFRLMVGKGSELVIFWKDSFCLLPAGFDENDISFLMKGNRLFVDARRLDERESYYFVGGVIRNTVYGIYRGKRIKIKEPLFRLRQIDGNVFIGSIFAFRKVCFSIWKNA